MASQLSLFLLHLLATSAIAAPQVGGNDPPAILSEALATILPTEAITAPVQYFSSRPAAFQSFASAASSFILANPSVFPSAASGLTAGGSLGLLPQTAPTRMPQSYAPSDRELPASLSSELAAIAPTVLVTNPSAYFATRPAAGSSYINELSSIIVNNPTYFPSAASALSAGPPFGGVGPVTSGSSRGPTQSMAMETMMTNAASSGVSAETSLAQASNPAQAMQTPALGLGLTGAAVAGIAGIAALL